MLLVSLQISVTSPEEEEKEGEEEKQGEEKKNKANYEVCDYVSLYDIFWIIILQLNTG